MDELPFKEVYIHGLVRDKNGHKMSKSKGNILDPIDIIDGIDLDTLISKRTEGLMQPEMASKIIEETKKEFPKGIPEFGVDALRFTFAIQATTGRDIRFDLNRIEGYRNFCNKLWNAARFVKINTEEITLDSNPLAKESLLIPDIWIQSKLHLLLQSIEKNIKIYRIDLVASSLYEFIWNDFCDWYLELSKSILNSTDYFSGNSKKQTKVNLLNTLDIALRALHPIVPFITEEIWKSFNFNSSKKSIMVSSYPKKESLFYDKITIQKVEWMQSFVTNIRQIRSEMNIAPKIQIPILLQDASEEDLILLNETSVFIKDMANIFEIKTINDIPPLSAISLLGSMKIYIPLEGLIDIKSERKRLEKKINANTKKSQLSESKT
ncbi:class I tRNA ligase family protein [Gammaproteobacteria bacterium]|nr:class I tRNA ligase family protein [Gammaproteobacteria bacterium]